jgi:hypothetical protein
MHQNVLPVEVGELKQFAFSPIRFFAHSQLRFGTGI